MKKTAIFCALAGIVMGAFSAFANINAQEQNTCSVARETVEIESHGAFDGMFFDARGVVDNICYGKGGSDGAYYLIYDDADAGMFYEAIRVSEITYATVLYHLERKMELTGTLKAVKDYETTVYEFQFEEI